MNNYCPVNSGTQVAGQFPCEAYLSVYTSCKACKSAKAQAEVQAKASASQQFSKSLKTAGIYVSGHSWHQDLKPMFIAELNFISHTFLCGEYVGWSSAFNLGVLLPPPLF